MTQEAERLIVAFVVTILAIATVAVSRRPRVSGQAGADAPKGEWALGVGMGVGALSLFALFVWAKQRGVTPLEFWVLGGVVAFGWGCGIARRHVYGRWN